MIYENILHLPEICNFQEAVNVRLALRTLRNASHKTMKIEPYCLFPGLCMQD